MKIQGYKIPAFIKTDLKSVQAVLIYGEDVGLTREYQADILKTLAVSEFNCVRLSAQDIEEDVDSIINASASQSLLGDSGGQVVRVDDITPKCAKAIETFLEHPRDGFLIIVSGNLTPSNAIRKLCEGAKNVAVLPCYMDDQRNIRTLVSETLQSHNIKISADALQWVQTHMGADRMMTRMELEKLVLYAGEDKSLDLDDVRQSLVDSGEHRVDDVVHAVANGHVLSLENGLSVLLDEGISAIQILRNCQSHFIKLHRARIDMDKGMSLDSATKSVFWKHKKAFSAQLQSWRAVNIVRALYLLAQAEKESKQTGANDFIILSRTFYKMIGLSGK